MGFVTQVWRPAVAPWPKAFANQSFVLVRENVSLTLIPFLMKRFLAQPAHVFSSAFRGLRVPVVFLFFLPVFAAQAQTSPPNGTLVVLMEGPSPGTGGIGAVEWSNALPNGAFTLIDSLANPGFGSFNDVLRTGSELIPPLVTAGTVAVPERLAAIDGNGSIRLYGLFEELGIPTGWNLLDSIAPENARAVAVFEDSLLVGRSVPPYLRTYDYQALFDSGVLKVSSLDTFKVRSPVEDILVVDSLAFLALTGFPADNQVVVVNLNTWDTLATIEVYPNPTNLLAIPGGVIVLSQDFGADGAVLTQISTTTLQVTDIDTLGIQCYGAIASRGTTIYLGLVDTSTFSTNRIGSFDTTLDFVADSLYLSPTGLYALEAANAGIFFSETDFFSVGSVGFWDFTTVSAPINTLISPRKLLWLEGLSTTRRQEAPQVDALKLFPNPTQGRTWLELPDDGTAFELTVLNANGQVVQKLAVHRAQQGGALIDLTGQPAGLYIADLRNETARYMQRILKN